ncbi:hypothetical protein [Polyangium jinanense]|uniref:Uncharacterized protein n=1 Tax=Polyangium jinanense TaxID=2829994 RepID=A0A9X3X6F9_9BACT|nr:hypothetical protein [Polyangium jinanense]MDC3955634.1 hypothetical protein [Polyangium jinanense]MDC3982276.1 hypothetical protein [Polyangium jinanense]
MNEPQEPGNPEPRILAAWREWLGALANDADAALAAADVYAGLAPEARDAWLDALAEDAPGLSVPLVALYAPLLAVEADPERRARMEAAIVLGDTSAWRGRPIRALSGMARGGARVVALVQPVYLRFVRVLWCRYLPDEGFFWARHDCLLSEGDAPRNGAVVDGVLLETTPLTPVVEELAHAILAHRRRGGELPASLREFADLFDADFEAIDDPR